MSVHRLEHNPCRWSPPARAAGTGYVALDDLSPVASPARATAIAARGEDGFTLIELLVVLVILALLFAAFSTLIASGINDSANISSDSVLETEVRFALDELTSELRQAYPPSATATSPFVTANGTLSSSSLTFYSPDMTFSAANPTGFYLEEVSYQLSGGNLERALAISTNTCTPTATTTCGAWTMPALGSPVIRVGSVVNSNIFTYYTGSDPPTVTTNPAQVASVVITLTVKTQSGAELTFSDTAMLRNQT